MFIRYLNIVKQIFSLPRVYIKLWGDEKSYNTYLSFTKRHPKYKIIQNKRYGVALISLPNSFSDYLTGRDKQALRTNRRKAIKHGFTFSSFSPLEHIDEILEINQSMKIRQSKPMNPDYLNVDALVSFFKDKEKIYGVFDIHGNLKAYAYTPIVGEVCVISRLLGHGEELDKGIMYFLISEVIREMIEIKNKNGVPLWIMYDTLFGASKGLKYFKERLGFKPYEVIWTWEQK